MPINIHFQNLGRLLTCQLPISKFYATCRSISTNLYANLNLNLIFEMLNLDRYSLENNIIQQVSEEIVNTLHSLQNEQVQHQQQTGSSHSVRIRLETALIFKSFKCE